MSLTIGRGPFGAERGTFDFQVPHHVRYWEPWPRRMRAIFAGQTVLDSRRGIVLYESGRLPVHWYPLEDFNRELLTSDPQAGGDTQRWSVAVADHVASGAVSAFATGESDDGGPPLDEFATVEFKSMDRWFEEDEPVYAHLRDSYHRVDVRDSSRRVVVRHGHEIIAESSRPKLLFETGLPVRYYLPFADVQFGALEQSETVSECPYKGDGQHWNLLTSAEEVADAAWSLPHPLPEALGADEHVCFYANKVRLEVDGEHVTD